MARRLLVTGADTFWGGRMIQALETDPSMEMILGMGARTPSVPFERAEFVRADQNYSILNRIVKATQVDTILHTFMVTNSGGISNRRLHEINVIGTMNLLAAAGASGSSVRHIVVKSSTLVYGSSARDPSTFHEDTPRSGPATHSIERALLEAESLVRDFSEDNPGTLVTVLRFANVLGPHLTTAISRSLSRPLCPSIFGFDPLLQFVEEDDVVRVAPPRHPGRHSRPLQRGRGGTPALERGGRHLRHPTRSALSLQPAADPPAGAAVRPPARVGGSPALRPWRRHPSPGRHRIQLPGHQRRGGAELHPRPPTAPCRGQDRRRPTPTSTTSSSSSATRPR